VFVQTVKHRDYFLDAPSGGFDEPAHEIPGAWIALISLALLIIALAAVVLLA